MTHSGNACALQRIDEDDHGWDAALSDRSTEAAPSEVCRAVRLMSIHPNTQSFDSACSADDIAAECWPKHSQEWVSAVQAVRSKYRAAFEAGLQALCQSDGDSSRPPPLLPHIYGSAEYLGDSSAGLGPPDKAEAGARSHFYPQSCPLCRCC